MGSLTSFYLILSTEFWFWSASLFVLTYLTWRILLACFGSYREGRSDNRFLTCFKHMLSASDTKCVPMKAIAGRDSVWLRVGKGINGNRNIRSDNFLICYLNSNHNYREPWCKSFNVFPFPKMCSFILGVPRWDILVPVFITTKRQSMEPQRAGTQPFGLQGNVKWLALRPKHRDSQNVNHSEFLGLLSIRCASLLILTLTGVVTFQCFWISVWKVWNWTGSCTFSLVWLSIAVK